MKTLDFFASHPVFSLAEATEVLSPDGGRSGTLNRLKYISSRPAEARVQGVYAVVPPAISVDRFLPDPIFVAAAVQPDGVFSHHSALELLGVAHSMWQQCTLYVPKRRRLGLEWGIGAVHRASCLLSRPHRSAGGSENRATGRLLQTTGPERTLVEGFYRLSLVGGAEELVRSASACSGRSGLSRKGAERYDIANLWRRPDGFWSASRKRSTFQTQCLQGWNAVARGQAIPRARSTWWNTGQEVEPDPSKRGFELGEPDER